MTNILFNINFNGNELQNLVLENLAKAPEEPKAGQIYFDTKKSAVQIFDGKKWSDLAKGFDTSRNPQSAEDIVSLINTSDSKIRVDKIEDFENRINSLSEQISDNREGFIDLSRHTEENFSELQRQINNLKFSDLEGNE